MRDLATVQTFSRVHQRARLTKPQLDRRVIDQLFVRMQSNYRHAWSSSWPSEKLLESAKTEWAFRLGAFSPERVDRAYSTCVDLYEMPPTLTQFHKVCCEGERLSAARVAERRERALPRRKPDLQAAEAGLAGLRAALGVSRS